MKTDRLKTCANFQKAHAAILRNPKDDVALDAYVRSLISMRQRKYARNWKRENKGLLYDRACIMYTARALHPAGSPGRAIAEFILPTRHIRRVEPKLIRKLFRYENKPTTTTTTADVEAEVVEDDDDDNKSYIDLDCPEEEANDLDFEPAPTPRPDYDEVATEPWCPPRLDVLLAEPKEPQLGFESLFVQ